MSIFSGKLEPTNSPYAVAKLSAIELADAMSKQFNPQFTSSYIKSLCRQI